MKKELVKPIRLTESTKVLLYLGEGCNVGNGCGDIGADCYVGNGCGAGNSW